VEILSSRSDVSDTILHKSIVHFTTYASTPWETIAVWSVALKMAKTAVSKFSFKIDFRKTKIFHVARSRDEGLGDKTVLIPSFTNSCRSPHHSDASILFVLPLAVIIKSSST
jgi:hypothetical protein